MTRWKKFFLRIWRVALFSIRKMIFQMFFRFWPRIRNETRWLWGVYNVCFLMFLGVCSYFGSLFVEGAMIAAMVVSFEQLLHGFKTLCFAKIDTPVMIFQKKVLTSTITTRTIWKTVFIFCCFEFSKCFSLEMCLNYCFALILPCGRISRNGLCTFFTGVSFSRCCVFWPLP